MRGDRRLAKRQKNSIFVRRISAGRPSQNARQYVTASQFQQYVLALETACRHRRPLRHRRERKTQEQEEPNHTKLTQILILNLTLTLTLNSKKNNKN